MFARNTKFKECDTENIRLKVRSGLLQKGDMV